MNTPNSMEWEAHGHCQRITTRQIQQWTGASERTARRWIKSPRLIPEPARRLITLCALGGVLPLEWRERGFRFWGDYLHTGNDQHFQPHHLEWQSLKLDENRNLKRQLLELRRDLADHREFIDYLQSFVTVADVIQFDRNRVRPSLTDGKRRNRLFQKPTEPA